MCKFFDQPFILTYFLPALPSPPLPSRSLLLLFAAARDPPMLILSHLHCVTCFWGETGAKLVSYDVDTGAWVFETFHWSRYAMSDDDDEDDDAGGGGGTARKTPGSAAMMPPPPALGPAGRVPRPGGATEASSKGVRAFVRCVVVPAALLSVGVYLQRERSFLFCIFVSRIVLPLFPNVNTKSNKDE